MNFKTEVRKLELHLTSLLITLWWSQDSFNADLTSTVKWTNNCHKILCIMWISFMFVSGTYFLVRRFPVMWAFTMTVDNAVDRFTSRYLLANEWSTTSPAVCLSVCLCPSVRLSVCLLLSLRLFVYLSLCLCVTLSVSPFVCLSVCLFICTTVSLSICLSISLSLSPSVCLFISQCVSLSVSPSVCLSLSQCVSLSVCSRVYHSLFTAGFPQQPFSLP